MSLFSQHTYLGSLLPNVYVYSFLLDVHLPILSDMFIFPLPILILYLSLTLLFLFSYTSYSSALMLFPHTSLESILSYIYNSNKSPYFSLIYIFSKHISLRHLFYLTWDVLSYTHFSSLMPSPFSILF